MSKLLAMIGALVGGYIGWLLGAVGGTFSGFLVSILGTAGGVYVARRITRHYEG